MFTTFFESLIDQLSLLRVADAIDILLVTVLVYIVLKFIRDTHTFQNHAAWFFRAGNYIPTGTKTSA